MDWAFGKKEINIRNGTMERIFTIRGFNKITVKKILCVKLWKSRAMVSWNDAGSGY
jgi:hypothetical protein